MKTNGTVRRRDSGNVGIEFTLIGIPMIFVLISTMEIARGMWAYNALGHCVREGVRAATRAGENCSADTNDCSLTVAEMVGNIRNAALAFPPDDLNVTLTSAAGSRACAPVAACLEDSTMWPPAGGNGVGSEVTISATYLFRSALAMYWPGQAATQPFGSYRLEATSTGRIQF
jgi:Flp pilus assembly protein TadG